MGRLNEMLGINENFKTESSKAIKNAFSLDATSKEDVDVLPLKAICPRYQNKYINDPKTTKALAKSIEKNGMLQPIVVIRIDDYLLEEIAEEEREYLTKMKDNYGCEYFISSGHRRYKACLSNAIHKDIETNEDIIKFYESLNNKDIYEKVNNPLLSSEEQKENDRLFIRCIILDLKNRGSKEETIYNDTNALNRATSTFELLANAIDSIGKEDPSIAEIKTYLYDRYGLEVSESTLYKNMDILNTFQSDPRFLDAIYDGKLSNRDAIKLKPIFKKIDKDKTIKQINNKTFNVETLKRELNKKKTAGRPKKRTYTKAEVMDLLSKIKIKEISIEEAMEIIKNDKA